MRVILSAIIGAVIGYITNYIAIKMLFRPYEEKRIFGLKIPFTPGLIPKERGRIASSIGNTISDHLLTTEVIAEALSSQGFKIKIRKWLEDKLINLLKSERTLSEFFKSFFGEKHVSIKEKLNIIIANSSIELLKNEETKKIIIDFLFDKIKKTNIKGNLEAAIINNKENIKIFLGEMIFKEDYKNITLKSLMTDEFADKIKEFVITNRDNIASFIKAKLKTPKVRAKISELLYDILQQNIGKFVAMLISPEFITQKAITSIDEYLGKSENKTAIAIMINDIIDNILDLKVNDILKFYGDAEEIKNKINEKIFKLLSREETIERALLIIRDNIINKPDMVNNLSNFINKLVEDPKSIDTLKLIIDSLLEKILNTKLFYLSNYIDEDALKELIDFLTNSADYILKENGRYFIESIDISKIVENRINQLDVEYAERIILDVAHRELSAITWLGALLGGILGLLNPLIEILLK